MDRRSALGVIALVAVGAVALVAITGGVDGGPGLSQVRWGSWRLCAARHWHPRRADGCARPSKSPAPGSNSSRQTASRRSSSVPIFIRKRPHTQLTLS